MKNVCCISLCYFVCCFAWLGCKQGLAKKETHKTETKFVIPANSVFTFEKATLTVADSMPVKKTEETKSIIPPSPVDVAKADAIEKFYWLGGGLFLLACVLFYRMHVKAGLFSLGGALATPLLAKFYSSDAAQYVALGSLCIAGAFFFAWHIMKRKGLVKDD